MLFAISQSFALRDRKQSFLYCKDYTYQHTAKSQGIGLVDTGQVTVSLI